MSQQEQKGHFVSMQGSSCKGGAFWKVSTVNWESGTSFSEFAATADNRGRRKKHGRLAGLEVNFKEPSSEKLQKMKANKAKRDSAKTTSTKDYIVQGVKEDYDLDKVLADLGEEPSKAKGPKASCNAGSQKPEANVSQKVASKKGRRGAGPTSEATN